MKIMSGFIVLELKWEIIHIISRYYNFSYFLLSKNHRNHAIRANQTNKDEITRGMCAKEL